MAGRSPTVKVTILGDEKNLVQSLGRVNKAVEGVEDKVGGLGDQMTGFAQALGGAFATQKVINFARTSITAAGDLGETISKTEELFGDAANAVVKFSESAASELGQSRGAAMDAAADFAVFGKAAGKTGLDLADFSTELVTLSSDLASFHNTRPEEAVYALGAALRGEYEPARRYGMQLDALTIQQKALEMGLWNGAGAIDKQAKTLATSALLFDQAGDAVGDFQRTADSATNSQRILAAHLNDTKVVMGQALLPVFELGLNILTPLVEAFNSLDTGMQNVILVSAVTTAGFVSVMNTVAGLKRSFQTLNGTTKTLTRSLGAVALVIEGAAIAYSLWRGHQQEVERITNELAGSIERQTNALLEQEGLLNRLSTSGGQAATAMDMMSLAFQESGYMTDNLKGALAELGLGADDLMTIISRGQDATRAWTAEQLVAAEASAEVAAELAEAIDAEDDIVAILNRVTGDTKKWADENMTLVAALEEVDDAAENMEDADDFPAAMAAAMKQLAVDGDKVTMAMLEQADVTDVLNNEQATAEELANLWVDALALAAEAEKKATEETKNLADARIEEAFVTGVAQTANEEYAKQVADQRSELARAAAEEQARIDGVWAELGRVWRDNADAIAGFGNRYDAFATRIGQSTGEREMLEANMALGEAWDKLDAHMEKATATLDPWNEAGRENIAVLDGVGDAIKGKLVATLKDADGNFAMVTAQAGLLTGELERQMKQAGFTEEQVDDYLYTLGLTPEQIETTIKLSRVDEARTNVQLFQSQIEELPDEVRVPFLSAVDEGDWIRAWEIIQSVFSGSPIRASVVWEGGGELRPPSQSSFVSNAGWTGLAHGGAVSAGMPYWVGERGSRGELFIPDTPGRIVPDYEVARAGGGGGINVTVNAGMGTDGYEVGRKVVEAIRSYERSNGSGWRK